MKKYLFFSISLLLQTRSSLTQQTALSANTASVNTEPWNSKYGTTADPPFSGLLSFSHLPYYTCLTDVQHEHKFDLAVLGIPFDTATTYRPGARFGPYAIRSGSRRQHKGRGYSLSWGINPYQATVEVVDCGDVPVTPFDNYVAIDQMQAAYETLLFRPVKTLSADIPGGLKTSAISKDGLDHPRIVTLGGDHTIILPILRSLYKVYGPISVIHFDSHIDTWKMAESAPERTKLHHGSYFNFAYEEGLMSNASIHAGIRNKLGTTDEMVHDEAVGFGFITADDFDDMGPEEIIKVIRDRVGNDPVYLSFDIDTIDPSAAPATGTPEAGGWTLRETKRIIRGLAGLNFVGADLVEVAPAYDVADITGIAAADLVHDFLSMMLLDEPPTPLGMFSMMLKDKPQKPLGMFSKMNGEL